MPELQPRSNTAEEILDIAEMLIQTRGYSAFSYQDIATRLDIRKASIHYHFQTKSALGAAVVERYAARIESALAALIADPSHSAMHLLDCYAVPYSGIRRYNGSDLLVWRPCRRISCIAPRNAGPGRVLLQEPAALACAHAETRPGIR